MQFFSAMGFVVQEAHLTSSFQAESEHRSVVLLTVAGSAAGSARRKLPLRPARRRVC